MQDKGNRILSSSIFKFPPFIEFRLVIIEKNSSKMYVVENCRRIINAFWLCYDEFLKRKLKSYTRHPFFTRSETCLWLTLNQLLKQFWFYHHHQKFFSFGNMGKNVFIILLLAKVILLVETLQFIEL